MSNFISDFFYERRIFDELKEMQESNPLEFQREMEDLNFGNALYTKRDFLYQIKRVLEESDLSDNERKYFSRLQYLLKALKEPSPIVPTEIKEAIDSLPRNNIFFIIDKLKENEKYKDWINKNPEDFINACLYGCYSAQEDKDRDSLFCVLYKRKIHSSKKYPELQNFATYSILAKTNNYLSFRPVKEFREENKLKVLDISFTLEELQNKDYYNNEDYIVCLIEENFEKIKDSLYNSSFEGLGIMAGSLYLGQILSDISRLHIDTPLPEIKGIDRCCFEDVINNISDFTITNLSSQIEVEEAFQYSSRFFKYLLDNNVYTKDLEDIED